MASILQLTDSAYFSCFKTQFHNVVAGKCSTGWIHVDFCHVTRKIYYLNTYSICEYLCNKCFPNFLWPTKGKKSWQLCYIHWYETVPGSKNKTWMDYDVCSWTKQIQASGCHGAQICDITHWVTDAPITQWCVPLSSKKQTPQIQYYKKLKSCTQNLCILVIWIVCIVVNVYWTWMDHLLSWQRQQDPLKYQCVCTKLHGITSKKAAIMVTAVRNQNVTFDVY